MTNKSIVGSEGGEPVVEFSGARVPEHTPADDTGRAGEVSGPQPSEEEFATAESSQIGSVATTTQDDKHGDVRACVDEHDRSVLPTALDSTGDCSHPDGDLGTVGVLVLASMIMD